MEITVENIVHCERRQKARIDVGIAAAVISLVDLATRGIIVEDCIQIQFHVVVVLCVARILIVMLLLRLME